MKFIYTYENPIESKKFDLLLNQKAYAENNKEKVWYHNRFNQLKKMIWRHENGFYITQTKRKPKYTLDELEEELEELVSNKDKIFYPSSP